MNTWEGKLFSLEQKTGRVLWQKVFDKSDERGNAVAITGNGLVCITINEKFSCLDEDNGKVVWQKEFLGGTAAAASGLLIISNADITVDSPDNTPVILAFSDVKNASLPQTPKINYTKSSPQGIALLLCAIIITGVCFLACVGLLASRTFFITTFICIKCI